MPRPIVLDSIKQREVRALLACGTSLRQAARYVGCAPATITNTAQRDTDFARQLEQARLDHDLSLLRDINRATARSWRAVIWALEHVQAEAFGGGRRVRGVAAPTAARAARGGRGLSRTDPSRSASCSAACLSPAMPHNLGDYPPHSNALPTAPATSTAEPAEVARARQSLAALARDPFVILEAAVVITGLDEPRRDLVLTYFSAMFASSQEMHFPESLSGQPGQPLPSDARSVAPAGFSDDPFEVLQGAVVAAGLDAQQTDRLLMTYAVLLDPSMVPLVADARALPGNGNPPAAE